ncbi:putative secreted protein (Por secretion system target), partial [Gillisia mitskevichiae]
GSLALSSNYILNYTGAAFDITQLTIAVTADAQTKTYGDADPSLTYGFSPALVSGDSFSGSLSRTGDENVGNYLVEQGSLALSSNYILNYTGAAFDITQLTIAVTADAQTKTYGDADPSLTYGFSPALVSGDSFSGTLSRTGDENVGNYAIEQGSLALSSNYILNYTGAAFDITQLTIAVTADAQTKTYGDADPSLTYGFSPALVSGDSFSGSLSRTGDENVGNYLVEQGSLALSSNYILNYTGAAFDITQLTIAVTADAQTKTYGDADPSLTYGFSPALVSGDSFNGTLSRTGDENVGNYLVEQGSLALSSNYILNYTGAAFEITAKTLTVTAVDKSKFCGQTITFTGNEFTQVGLVNGDVISSTTIISDGAISSASATGSPYAINISGAIGTGLSNYNIFYVPGELTVKTVTLDVTNAQMPRSINEDVIVTIGVKDGTTNLTGVLVTLNVVGFGSPTTTSINGIARFNLGKLDANLYPITAMAGGCSATDIVFLPIYDPAGGFVTGGGWIDSPVGAMTGSNADAVGKANFGFNAKYKTGKNNTNEVDGNTNFQFKAGDLHFSSATHDNMQLVISGAKATYTGTGTVNGVGNHKFRVIAIDGDVNGGGGTDKFRIMIWDNNSSSSLLYDNKRGVSEVSDDATVIGGGSIVIHKPKGNSKAQEVVTKDTPIIMQDLQPEILETLAMYPNPVVSASTLSFSLKEDSKVILRVYDYSGRLVETLFSGFVRALENKDINFERKNLMSGIYIVKLTTQNGQSYDKRIIVE